MNANLFSSDGKLRVITPEEWNSGFINIRNLTKEEKQSEELVSLADVFTSRLNVKQEKA